MSAPGRTRAVEVTAGGLTLSGLLAEPDGTPRALVVALHGHGMTARYFAGPADPALSLLELGAALGFTVWAPDRVGYGASATVGDPSLLAMIPQSDVLSNAVDRFANSHDVGAGCVLLGHSFGLKLSLAIAARPPSTPVIGVDGAGTGITYAFQPGVAPPSTVPGDEGPAWGPPHLYPPATFRPGTLPAAPLATPPENEGAEWPDAFRRFGPHIRVPVRFTFGEHDRLWVVSEEHFDVIRSALPAAPSVAFDVQRGAGHNVSLSWAARAYHLKALAFAEECVLAAGPHRTTANPR
jgi:pimeloyl-ACP methyl ester carboxylesterase